MIDKIGNKSLMLERALDAAWLRNEVISNNIANVNTPNFKKSSVRFEELLVGASDTFQISATKKDSRFLPIGKDNKMAISPMVIQENSTSMRRDGNNVDIDVEMAELARNTIKYNALIAQMSKEFGKIKLAINGR